MSGDVHVRFCESLGVKFPRATQPKQGYGDIDSIGSVIVILVEGHEVCNGEFF